MKREFNTKAKGSLTRQDTQRMILGQAIPDPYQGLENLESSSTRRWIDQQEELFRQYIEDMNPDKPAANVAHKGIPNKVENGYIFYFQSETDQLAGINISQSAEGKGRPLISASELSSDKNQQILKAAVSPDGKNLAYLVSENGRPETTLRIRNIASGEDLTDTVDRVGHVWWDKDGQGLVYNQLSDDGLGRVILKHHSLGESQEQDTNFYEPPETQGATASLMHGGHLTHTSYNGGHEWLFTGGYDAKLGLSIKNTETGRFEEIFPAGVAEYEPIGDLQGGVLMRTTRDAPNGKVVLFDPENPEQEFKTVIPESPDHRLKHVFMNQDRLVALYNDNCADRVDVFDVEGNKQFTAPLPEQSKVTFSHASISGISLGGGAPLADDEEVFMQVDTFTAPPAPFRFDLRNNILTPIEPETRLDGPESDIIVEQLWATSKDGTQIPMTVMRHQDTDLDGTAALKITGYGGFGASPGPHYDAQAQNFVRGGGIFVQANIRGGGEFGEAWHQQGCGLHQQNTFDDFAACAQRLVDIGYTTPSRMVAEGQSQGGLTVLATMQQNPGLFGAVIASVPVADLLDKKMKGFASEYGDPYASKADLENLKRISPLHNVQPDRAMPACLIRTAAQDKQLISGALKLVATMQHEAPQNKTFLHVEHDYGHMVSRPKRVADKEFMEQQKFIERSIGPVNQEAFRQSLSGPSVASSARTPAKPC